MLQDVYTHRVDGREDSIGQQIEGALDPGSRTRHIVGLLAGLFLLKILMSAFFVRDRPGRASPRKSKKAIDSRAQPGEPNITSITRRIEPPAGFLAGHLK